MQDKTKDARKQPRDGKDARRGGGKADRGPRAKAPQAPRLPPIELRSVVDRGRTGAAVGEGDEARTEEAAWTIAKVALVDPGSKKTVSTAYELLVGEARSEFKSLAEARAAVGRTIVHAPKRTPSKADHAAAKGRGGKK